VTLRQVVEESDTRLGRYFDLTVQTLVLISVVSFSIGTLPGLAPETQRALDWIEVATVAVFTLEYGLRIWVTERKLGYVCSFFGAIDLLAILPFYLSLGLDFRSVRAFRFLRLFRIFKMARYNEAVGRIHLALIMAREELILTGVLALVLLYLSAVGIHFFEADAQPDRFGSVFHSLWWAIATLTTVGYGDVYPITVGGRIFTFFVLVVGIGVIAVPTGLFASALTRTRDIEKATAQADKAPWH
jgi:voltage-gated potassium channel